MKRFPIIIFLVLPFFLTAQLDVNSYLIQQIGIESNPLRNPGSYFNPSSDTLDEIDLRPMPLFSYTKFYLKGQKKWDKVNLSLRPIITCNFYPDLREANYLRAELEQKLSFKLNKRWRIYQKAFVRSSQRNGENQEEVFSTPRSYNRSQLFIGSTIKPNRQWQVNLEANYIRNNFVTEEEQINYYSGVGGLLELKKKYKNKEVLNNLIFTAQIQRRLWKRGTLLEIDFEEEEEIDDWAEINQNQLNYWRTALESSLQFSEGLEWSPSITFSGRISDNNAQNWNSIQLSSQLAWEKDKFNLLWTSSISRRIHPYFSLSSENLDPLIYLYLRNRITISYHFNEQISALLSMNSLLRLSNFEDDSKIAYRGYENSYIRVGSKIKF